MNKRILVSLMICALLLSPLLHVGYAQSAASYSESVKIYVAGQNALWFMSFSGVNATDASLSGIESHAGLDSYSITAVKFSGSISDFQVFGNDGYKLIGLPFIPQEGLFVTIGSANQSLVDSLVGSFDIFLQTALMPLSTSGSNHTFFSPVDFDRTAAPKLFKYVPTSAKGFASLFTQSQFAALPTPIIRLDGVKSQGGFMHEVTIGSEVSSAVDSSGNLVFANLFRLQTNSSLAASSISNRTEVYVRALDGFVVSGDRASVENNALNFSGRYSVSVPSGQKIRPNISVLSEPPVAIGTRILDHGSAGSGDFLAVTLEVQNLGSRGSIRNLTVDDSWWRAYSQFFQLARGNSSFSAASIAPGQNYSNTYVLKIIGSNKSDIMIPPTWGSYAYGEGGQSFSSHVLFNQAEVRLNDVGPAITLDARSSVRPGSPLGTSGKFVISVRNLGNGPALNLQVLNYSLPSLAQNGGVWRFNVSMPLASLTENNVTKTFRASWQTPSGSTDQTTSNRVMVLFSHTSMVIPYIKVRTSPSYTLVGGQVSANLTYTFQNLGMANSSAITGRQSLPEGVSCVGTSSTDGSCAGAEMTVRLGKLGIKPVAITFQTTVGRPSNFIIMPFNTTAEYRGIELHTYSSAALVPAGFSVKKAYQPNALFGGMNSLVVVTTGNSGPLDLYNVSFSSLSDSFDTIVGQQGRAGLYQLLQSNHSIPFNYTVSINPNEYGVKRASPINASFVFAGTPLSRLFSESEVSIFKPVTFSVTTVPANPTETRPFSVAITFVNSAPVPVSQVRLQLQLPSGLQLLNSTASVLETNGELLVSTPQLGPNSSYDARLTFRASGGMQIDLSKSNLTFSFQGATVHGQALTQSLTIGEDITARYTEPIVLAVLVMLAAVIVIRRRIPAISPSSQKGTPQKQA